MLVLSDRVFSPGELFDMRAKQRPLFQCAVGAYPLRVDPVKVVQQEVFADAPAEQLASGSQPPDLAVEISPLIVDVGKADARAQIPEQVGDLAEQSFRFFAMCRAAPIKCVQQTRCMGKQVAGCFQRFAYQRVTYLDGSGGHVWSGFQGAVFKPRRTVVGCLHYEVRCKVPAAARPPTAPFCVPDGRARKCHV